MKTPIADLDDFTALDPFFRIIPQLPHLAARRRHPRRHRGQLALPPDRPEPRPVPRLRPAGAYRGRQGG
jgi:hypothetical protein